jgi:hypothetical protein
MPKMDRIFALVGVCVSGLLTWYAYCSNGHPQAPRLSAFVYLLLFPSSICLMLTENASPPSQALIVAFAIFANGGLYALISALLRAWWAAERPIRPSGPQSE